MLRIRPAPRLHKGVQADRDALLTRFLETEPLEDDRRSYLPGVTRRD